jgi:four helix bundle protein
LQRYSKNQLLRAASSVPLNLAEGVGRNSLKDKAHFYQIAFGSIKECQAIFDLTVGSNHPIRELADKLAAHTFRLIKATRGS